MKYAAPPLSVANTATTAKDMAVTSSAAWFCIELIKVCVTRLNIFDQFDQARPSVDPWSVTSFVGVSPVD